MEKLKAKDINVDDFRFYLTTRLGCGDFISSISSVSEMIQAVTMKRYWDYYNYKALEGIIDYFCKDDSEMTGWMEEYESRLFAFKTTTKIAEYVKSCTDAELMDDANNEVLFDKTFYKKLYLSSSETMRIAS